MFRFPSLIALLAGIVLLIGTASPLFAADPVELEVNGVDEGAALKNVREALTLPTGMVRDGTVDRLWLDRFAGQAAEKTRIALEPFGYYHALVAVSVREPKGGRYLLVVQVTLGEPVRVTGVQLELKGAGAGESALTRLVRSFPLSKGGVLLQTAYERAKGDLRSRAVALGYLDAEFTRHEIRIAPGELSASIALTLETGERYYFDEVSIEGAPDYPEPYLKRFVSFTPGEVFSYAKLAETQLNFANSERFKQVVITPQKDQAKGRRVPVLVQLTSAPRRSLRPGVGYGTDTGGRFTVRFRDLNLFHRGHELDLNLYAAQRLQGFAARYTIPSAHNIKSSTVVQLNLQQEDVTTYQSELAALELDLNHGFGKGELGTAYVKIQEEKFTIAGESSGSRLVLPGYRFSKENFDNMVRPTRGYRYTLDLRAAHPYLGSDTALAQFIAEGNTLLPLPWRTSLHLRSKVGATMLADPLANLPPSIRFFAGGDESVRGYDYQSLGPRDATGQVVGGRHLIFGSVELERYLYTSWGVSIFHDAGNAFSDFNQVHLLQAAGVGVHYYSPVGGLNLSLAKPLDVGGWTRYRIVFTVGFQL
jgi:translocation and assembly module TamA